MLLHLKTLLKSLVFPPIGPLLLAFAGVCLMKRRPRTARLCLMLGLGALWLLSTAVVADALTALVERYPPVNLRSASAAQAVVILGGGGQRANAPEYGGPAADPTLLERLSYGAYMARKTGLPILVTGYHVEAAAMQATLLRTFGIEARWVDAEAYDTFENARNAVRLLKADGVQRIVLVTSTTHMSRAAQEFSAAGAEVVPAPVGMLSERETGIYRYLPNTDALGRSDAAINELLGEQVRHLLAVSHVRQQSAL